MGLSSLFFWVSCCPSQNKIDYFPGEDWSYAFPITVRGPHTANTKALAVSTFVDGEHRDGFLIWGDGRGEAFRPFTFHAPITVQEIYAKGDSTKWPDYVFSPDYRLLPLSELEAYVQAHRHLPGLPPAVKIEQEGLPLTQTHLALVRKVEELTLYVIALQKQVDSLRAQLQASSCK